MINIYRTHVAEVEITYITNHSFDFIENMAGSMDSIAEHICNTLVKNNFPGAHAVDCATGELLLQITRS